jgi:hypothetical protein
VDQGREERSQVDEALLTHVQRQPSALAVVRVGLQPGQLRTAAGPAETDPTLVANDAAGKLIKIGAKVTRHAKYVTFQLAEVAVTRNLFATILDRIARLAIPPPVVGLIRV